MLQQIDYHQAQRAIEAEMAADALRRQKADNENASARNEWSSTKAGTKYVKSVMDAKGTEDKPSFTEQVHTFMFATRAVGRHPVAAKMLAQTGIEPRTVAFLASKAIFNFLGIYGRKEPQKKSSLSMRIGDYIHDEWRCLVFSDNEKRKQLLHKLMRDFDRRSYPREWRKRTIKNYFDAEQVEWQGWDLRQKILVGYSLLSIFKDCTGMVEFTDDGTYVEASEAMLDHVSKLTPQLTYQYLLYRPMVVPPKPWTEDNLFRGGYLTKQVRPYSLVKGARKRDVARLMECDLSRVLPAVNAMQETPWRVNREMLSALTWAYSERPGSHLKGVGKLPACEEEAFPEIPEGYHTDPEVKKRHNLVLFNIRDRRREDKSKRLAVITTLSSANVFKTYPAIYFPHNLDTRGRAYPLPAFLNPQGPDYVKGLIEFAEGVPASDPTAARWIAIATANAYGNDKVSLDDRVTWTHENSDMILSIANDYKSDLRWTEASEAFQFLRCCFEWRDLMKFGTNHVSHMVIPVDATNSGLQHYSAMLRDEVGGYYVNLIPGHARQDIYGKVADVAVEELMITPPSSVTYLDKDDVEQEAEIHPKHLLSLGITRKATKRQVMVVPYAGKFSSCLAYTKEWLKDQAKEGQIIPWDTHHFTVHSAYVSLLSKAIWNAIDETVIKGKHAMRWLSQIASEYSKAMNATDKPVYDRRMCWKTPDGFEVVHFREDETQCRVETHLEGRQRLSYWDGSGKLNPKDMALAVAPNFVHALDATHLRATIMLARDQGITSFAMIHDSFGVHAGLMNRFLNDAVKPAFVTMYQNDVLGDFARQFEDTITIPAAPEQGTLDLEGVRDSEFFFS